MIALTDTTADISLSSNSYCSFWCGEVHLYDIGAAKQSYTSVSLPQVQGLLEILALKMSPLVEHKQAYQAGTASLALNQ